MKRGKDPLLDQVPEQQNLADLADVEACVNHDIEESRVSETLPEFEYEFYQEHLSSDKTFRFNEESIDMKEKVETLRKMSSTDLLKDYDGDRSTNPKEKKEKNEERQQNEESDNEG